MIAGTNLTQSVPDKENILKAIDTLEFLVVVDTMPMEITGYADVILPECTYLERYDDMRAATWRTPSVALRMPAVEPKHETKPAWWIAKQIGERLGLHEYYKYNDYTEVLDWQLKQIGSSLEEMKKLELRILKGTMTNYILKKMKIMLLQLLPEKLNCILKNWQV